GTRDLAKRPGRKRSSRGRPELGVIENVESFEAEEQLHSLSNQVRCFLKSQVHVDVSRSSERVSPKRPIETERACSCGDAGIQREVAGIEPVVRRHAIERVHLVRVECLNGFSNLVGSHDFRISGARWTRITRRLMKTSAGVQGDTGLRKQN